MLEGARNKGDDFCHVSLWEELPERIAKIRGKWTRMVDFPLRAILLAEISVSDSPTGLELLRS